MVDNVLSKTSATAKAVYLINCLLNVNEHVGMNLTGNSSKNQPRKAMDPDIRDSIIGMVTSFHSQDVKLYVIVFHKSLIIYVFHNNAL